MKDGSRVSDYEYDLSPGRIAQYPTERRDQSRLLVVPWGSEPFEHRVFSDLVDLLLLRERHECADKATGSKSIHP